MIIICVTINEFAVSKIKMSSYKKKWWETQSLIPLEPCSSMWVCGSTGAGKTRWVYRLLQHLHGMFANEPPVAVLYCYGIYQPLFEEIAKLPSVTLHEGLPTSDELDEFTRDRKHKRIVLDDLMQQVITNDGMELLFTQGCHHRRVSVVFVTQNLLPQGKNSRNIAQNTSIQELKSCVSDAHVGRQIFPNHKKFLVEAYEDIIKTPHNYLLVDLTPHAKENYRVRSSIFPGEDTVVYRPKL